MTGEKTGYSFKCSVIQFYNTFSMATIRQSESYNYSQLSVMTLLLGVDGYQENEISSQECPGL